MAHFTIIGLGSFGLSACLELIHLGHTVTGIDSDPKVAEMYVEYLNQVVICDCTDENALRELDLKSSDTVLVAIGEDMQSSILCTLCLKNIGVENIWVKANTKAHHTIISKLGVSRIIHPEEEMGIRVAQALNYPTVNDYITLGDGYYVVEIHIKEHLHNHAISSLLGGTPSSTEPLMVKRNKENITHLNSKFLLQSNDTLLLCGKRAALKKISPRLL
ncbi:TrkA family potassium uptake protein [Pseudocolwellia sp. AS88]|uniref:potassium channel family protein n=1 Tax=Pseudocolwellia sp. AS88 TaxID=3063958 RepID=UPI0026F235C3|nr:TrkA family potassium uptake protein [Pseudocolwellia sp. AS88]MDO7083356.1 TrkA family potassium uptake protein [Pseudocolwellia sp. AS88]